MADRTFTLDWRLRTKRNETLTRGQLGSIDARISTRKRLRIPSPLPPLPPSSTDARAAQEQEEEAPPSTQPVPVAAPSSHALPATESRPTL
jgi:hypothetical protein